MLVEFGVENYLSFHKRVTLSMVASKDKSLPSNVIRNAGGTGVDLLKAAAIYGPNASGKTNLLRALSFATGFVVSSAPRGLAGGGTGRIPFALDLVAQDGPSHFRIVCIPTLPSRNGRKAAGLFELELELDDRVVLSESLHLTPPKARRRRIFTRSIDPKSGKQKFGFAREWATELRQITKLVRENASFVSAAATWGSKVCSPLAESLQNVIEFGPGKADDENWTLSPALCSTDELTAFVKSHDVGIEGILVEETRPDDPSVHSKRVRYAYMGRDKSGNRVPIELPDSFQSEGTRRLVRMFLPLKGAGEYSTLVLLDEFDAHLHPVVARNVLSNFFGGQSRVLGGQIIFTTHDTELMDLGLLRRDQIFLTEKNPEGASELYSLWDFEEEGGERVRKDADVRSRYMVGRYGAIPIIR